MSKPNRSVIRLYALAVLLVLAGAGLILYPGLRDGAADREQRQILEQWQREMAAQTAFREEKGTPMAGVPSPSSVLPAQTPSPSPPALADIPLWEDDPTPRPTAPPDPGTPTPKPTLPPAEGVLSIEAIDLVMPILTGATRQNLHLSIASIEGTAKAGQPGNYGIAGHRSRTRGRNFNRLGEVREGDVLQVETADGSYHYAVDEILLVLPEDTWVLAGDGASRRITLVTCDPMIDPTHRLIVKGTLIEQ